jgi:hypothetical protein
LEFVAVPVTYSIDSARRLIRTTCSGPVTPTEVIEHFRTLPPESSDLGRVVAGLRAQEGELPFRLCAIVAPSDLWFGTMRMFEVFASKYFRAIRVFRNLAAAEAWLTSLDPDTRAAQ